MMDYPQRIVVKLGFYLCNLVETGKCENEWRLEVR